MNLLHENIDPEKYLYHIDFLYDKLKHMLVNKLDLDNVAKISKDKTGKILSIRIFAKTKVDGRLIWKSINNKIVGTLSSEEVIEYDENKDCYYHSFFSFHFEPEPCSDVKMLRIDYKPACPLPLHAHAYDYDKTHKHLEYPSDTSLYLKHIDFCTIMLVISYYIKHPKKYPLFCGDDYNKRVCQKRRKYDEV